jgi:hypothetical protein
LWVLPIVGVAHRQVLPIVSVAHRGCCPSSSVAHCRVLPIVECCPSSKVAHRRLLYIAECCPSSSAVHLGVLPIVECFPSSSAAQFCVRAAFSPLWWCLRWRRMAVTLRLEEGGRESQHRLYRSRVSPLCLVLVLEVMKDSISEGLRRLTPQRIALLCGNIATVPDTLKG